MNDTASDQVPHPGGEQSSSGEHFRWRLMIPLVLVLLAFLLVPLGVIPLGVTSSMGDDSPAIGKPAPQVELVRLSDDLDLDRLQRLPAGQVTLLHFWGTWCGPCKMEYPHLSLLARRLQADERFQFVPVACEYGPDETLEGLWHKTRDFFGDHMINSVAFADPSGVTRRSVAERLQRDALFYPTSILIDPEGKIAAVWEGYTPQAVHQIEAVSERLLAEIED